MVTCTQLQIVLVGSGEQTIAAYNSLSRKWQKQLKKGAVRIIIISAEENYECQNLFGEIIAGRLELQTAAIPLAELAPYATILHGDIGSIDKNTKQIEVVLKNGKTQELWYDHLVLDNSLCLNKRKVDVPSHVFSISTTEQVRLLCRQIDLLVKQAAICRNPLMAKNLLRFVMLAQSAKDVALASFIEQYIAARCSRYYALQAIKAECFLVYESEDPENRFLKETIFQTMLNGSRITVIDNQKIQRFTPEAVVLDNGSFLAASMIIDCSATASQKLQHPFVVNENGEIIPDRFLRVNNESFVWCGSETSSQRSHATNKRTGTHIARNIILAAECGVLQPLRRGFTVNEAVLFPNKAAHSFLGLALTGRAIRHIHLAWQLVQLPSAKMRSQAFVNLISHLLWKKTKLEAGLIHYGYAPGNKMRAAS